MASLAPLLRQRFFGSNGEPLAGGKLYSYLAGSSTPAATYTDSSASTPNTNPVILDADGYADVWIGSGSYKFVLDDALDVNQWTTDYVSGSGSSSSVSGWATHSITNNQAATDLSGETLDLDDYSSATYEVEILRGTTILSNGTMAIQNINGTARVVLGGLLAEESSGVTFSVSQASTIAQLRAAVANDGGGDGTIKLRRVLISI